MFGFFKKLFKRNKNKDIKRYSSTLAPANEGFNSKRECSQEIDKILTKLESSINSTETDNINNIELNKLVSYYFNKPDIPPGFYKLNISMLEGLCFNIEAVGTILDKDNRDVTNIILTMKEYLYNSEFYINISVKEFHDFFKYIEPPKQKRNS